MVPATSCAPVAACTAGEASAPALPRVRAAATNERPTKEKRTMTIRRIDNVAYAGWAAGAEEQTEGGRSATISVGSVAHIDRTT